MHHHLAKMEIKWREKGGCYDPKHTTCRPWLLGCSAASGTERRVFKDDVTDDRRSRRQTTQGLTWNLAASCSVFLHIAQVMAGKVKVERGLRRVTDWQRQAQMHTLLVKAPETAGTACWHWHLMNEYECTSFTLKWKFLNKVERSIPVTAFGAGTWCHILTALPGSC